MNIENFSDSEIRSMEAETKTRQNEVKPTFQHYGSTESLSDSESRSMEAEIKARQNEVKPTFQHYGSTESLSDSETRSMEAEIKTRQNEVKPTFQHYGSAESLSDSEIRSMEAEIKARQNEVKPTFQHYGSAESLSDSEIRSMEAEIKARQNEVKPTFQHYGSAESLSENDINIIEAQVAEKRRQDIPYKEYLASLITNPNITDSQQFEDAVIQSMKSNGIMKNFTNALVEEISKQTYNFKNIDKVDAQAIQMQKQKIENLINVYVKYLYAIKKQDFTFFAEGNYFSVEKITEEMLEDLWQVQKNFNITFNMPIPKDLGEYYGKAFERMGKMTPGITLMYDELQNKQVNWHQILIYKENELTPQQRYKQSQEEKRKAFENARAEEINNHLIEQKRNFEQSNAPKGR